MPLQSVLPGMDYGYGLFVHDGFYLGSDYYDLVMVEHGGDINGFAANIYWIPSLGIATVSFASADGAHFTESIAAAFDATGRMPAYIDTGLNVVHVDDVAQGHLLAQERGVVGERYILGSHNVTHREFLTRVAEIAFSIER